MDSLLLDMRLEPGLMREEDIEIFNIWADADEDNVNWHAAVIVLDNKTILDPATIVLLPVILTANLPAAFYHYHKANR